MNAASGAEPEESGAAAGLGRPGASVFLRRRLVAAAIAAAIVAAVWLAFGALTTGSGDFAGTWVTTNDLLGNTTLVISAHGTTYSLTGVNALGSPSAAATLNDGRLVATGGSAVNRWRLELQLLDDNRQIVAHLSRGPGSPQIDRYTRL